MKHFILHALLHLVALCTSLYADAPSRLVAPAERLRVKDAEILDADTVRGEVELPYGISLRGQSIRALGYDAWESSKRRQSQAVQDGRVTDAEVVKGKAAAEALRRLAAGGAVYVVPDASSAESDREQRDPYGRLLGYLWVRTKAGEWVELKVWAKTNGYIRADPKRES